MFTAIHTCATASRRGVFSARRKRRPQRPLGCTLHELRELSEETGFSVDDVISRLDDFLSADALLGVGMPLLDALEERARMEVREEAPLPKEEPEDFLRVEAPEIFPGESSETPPLEETLQAEPIREEPLQEICREEPVRQEVIEPELVEEEPAGDEPLKAEPIGLFPEEELPPIVPVKAPVEEPEDEPWMLRPFEPPQHNEEIDLDFDGVTLHELRETTTVYVEEALTVRAVTARAIKKFQEEEERKKAEAEKVQEAEVLEAEATETVVESVPKEPPQIARSSAVRFFRKAEPEIVVETPGPVAQNDAPQAPTAFTRETPKAEPEIVVESAAEVVEAEAVANPPEKIVWPWEIMDCPTLKEALESLDDKALTALTEEIVDCTTSGSLGDGAIKSLCATYRQDMQKVYSAIQKESSRRISRMNRKKPVSSAGMDSTQEMAMRMAKKFLGGEMCRKAMRFESPWPDADGNYYIIQSHRVDDEDSLNFPNERTYYQEMGDGWAISVGY